MNTAMDFKPEVRGSFTAVCCADDSSEATSFSLKVINKKHAFSVTSFVSHDVALTLLLLQRSLVSDPRMYSKTQ